jgi:uncharacterized protein YkwD
MTKRNLFCSSLVLALSLAACTTEPPAQPVEVGLSSSLRPQGANVVAGSAPITISLRSVPSGQTVSWSASPAGVGTLVGNGSSATYTPPPSIAQSTNVTVTAQLSNGGSGSLALTVVSKGVTPPPAPSPTPPAPTPPAPTPPAPTPPAPSSDATAYLNAINAVRAVGRNCGSTTYPAAPALKWNAKLETAALLHSQDMATQDYFSHTGKNGSQPWDRMTAAGYAWRAAAENIAAGQPDLASVMDGWVKSPGHCANLMSVAYTEVGMAKATNSSAAYRIYWTQNFGAPR